MCKGYVYLSVGNYNGYPGFTVNGSHLTPDDFLKGIRQLEFEYDYDSDIIFKMTDKGSRDTQVENGKILADKFINIEKLTLEFVEFENWQFHKHIWDPYFAFNEQEKCLTIPTKEYFPIWCLKLLET